MKVKIATGLIKRYMESQNYKGWTSFWDTIYVMPGYEKTEWLLRHESKHLEQIKREGRILFSLKYLWWSWRVGYKNNPYEIEAREAEGLHEK